MSPATHVLTGWLIANTAKLNTRDRIIITLAGIIPDIDGLGLVLDMIQGNPTDKLEWWGTYHHVLGHNILFALIVMLLCLVFAIRRRTTVFLVFISFHIHLLFDIAGARGPDNYQWPVPYLWPFSDRWQLTWSGQWMLNSWQNVVVTGMALLVTFYLAWKRGFSPLGMISEKTDAVFVQTLRKRFGNPAGGFDAGQH